MKMKKNNQTFTVRNYVSKRMGNREKDVLRKKGEFEKVYIQKFMCSAIFRIKDCSRGSVLPQR